MLISAPMMMLSDPAARDAMVTGPATMEILTSPAMDAWASKEPA